jgi:nucleoid DNA-binding protein
MNKTKPKPHKIRNKELIAMVAKRMDYRVHEVKDVFLGLAVILAEELNKGHVATLEGVGTFSVRTSRPRTFKAGLTGLVHTVQTKRSCSVKPDSYMVNALNGVTNNKPSNETESTDGNVIESEQLN